MEFISIKDKIVLKSLESPETVASISNDEKAKIIKSLLERHIITEWIVASTYETHTGYSLSPLAERILKTNIYWYNLKIVLSYIDKNKTWIAPIAGLIAIVTALKKFL